MRNLWIGFLAVCLTVPAGDAAESALSEKAFQDKSQQLKRESQTAQRPGRARDLFRGHRMTSQQVKHIATLLPDDQARYDFALAVLPAVVDPENFYEVYDAFTSLSKVMRLHDQVSALRHPPIVTLPGLPPQPQPVAPAAMQEIVKSLRGEPFHDNRLKLARQIIGASRQPFLAAQIKEMMELFPFDDDRLALAKFAYDYTLDTDQYFQVSTALKFPSSREQLTRYLESKRQGK